MRTLLLLFICTIVQAQRPEDAVLALYRQMEKAEQTGDANTLIALWSRESISNAEKMRPYIRPRPDARYTSSKVFVQGDQAALLGRIGKDQFLSMRLVKEDAHWKVKDQLWSDKEFPADSVYAIIPPPPAPFERAGAPWEKAAPALDAAAAASQGWQLRATYDESALYIRIESTSRFPAPGSDAETPPSGWPVMKVAVSGVGEFVLHPSADIGDQATFGKNGRADSHRHFVSYSLLLERADQAVFQAIAGLHPDPLIRVEEHFFDLRVPLRTMGIMNTRGRKITIGDAQWPKSAIFSLEVQPYP